MFPLSRGEIPMSSAYLHPSFSFPAQAAEPGVPGGVPHPCGISACCECSIPDSQMRRVRFRRSFWGEFMNLSSPPPPPSFPPWSWLGPRGQGSGCPCQPAPGKGARLTGGTAGLGPAPRRGKQTLDMQSAAWKAPGSLQRPRLPNPSAGAGFFLKAVFPSLNLHIPLDLGDA